MGGEREGEYKGKNRFLGEIFDVLGGRGRGEWDESLSGH